MKHILSMDGNERLQYMRDLADLAVAQLEARDRMLRLIRKRRLQDERNPLSHAVKNAGNPQP